MTTSNTVPSPYIPPEFVVPNRLPEGSAIRPAHGNRPLLPLKLTRVLRVAIAAMSVGAAGVAGGVVSICGPL